VAFCALAAAANKNGASAIATVRRKYFLKDFGISFSL